MIITILCSLTQGGVRVTNSVKQLLFVVFVIVHIISICRMPCQRRVLLNSRKLMRWNIDLRLQKIRWLRP